MLTGKQILAARDKKTVEVHVPEWAVDGDDTVLVGTMGALDYAALQDWIESMDADAEPVEPVIDETALSCDSPELAPKKKAEKLAQKLTNSQTFELMVRWCLYSILDPKTQQPAFNIEQVRELGAKSFSSLEKVYQAALELNRLTKESAEEFEKNLGGTEPSDSGGG